MSITAYVGLPGHGKSYGVVENVIVPACQALRTVFTNIPCNVEAFQERFGIAPVHFDVQDIIDNPDWWTTVFEPGAIIVIDECWRLWPAGMNANRLRESDKSFFAEHRHMVGDSGHSTEIVLVTQDLSQIASFMRNLVETTFRVTKLSKMGTAKLYRVDVYSGPVTGPAPPIARREREIPGKFKKDIYALYQSHTKSQVGAGNESRADGRFNVLKGFQFKLIIGALVVLSVLVWLGAGTLFQFGDKKPGIVAPPQARPLSAAPVSPASSSYYYRTAKDIHPDDFIAEADRVYISYNAGRFPNIEYQFRVIYGEGYADLNVSQLLTLGYTVDPVAQCLVKISRDNQFYMAVCESAESGKRDFISDLTNETDTSGARGETRASASPVSG